jgi:hypothetical protein
MSESKPKSTMRQLLESGPTDPLILAQLSLLEQLQDAHAKGDQQELLEIGRKLAANAKDIEQAQGERRALMATTVADAKSAADPDQRTKKLLAAFALCVKEACAADEEVGDIDTYNFGVKQLGVIGDALSATPPNRFSELAQFLDSSDIQLRAFAAVWLRQLMPERVLPILKEINKTEPFGTPAGTQVFTAIFELETADKPDAKT